VSGLEPHWFWLGLGLALAAAEIAAPGFFLIWLAGAALLTGVAAWAMPLGMGPQVVLFAMCAMGLVLIARRWVRPSDVTSADPLMNDRGGRLVGEVVQVTQAIANGHGRVRQGDGEWLVRGPDAPVGAQVRVVGHDGAVLVVEPVQ
jgi:membrane protein implicated in regulation of membrane protease activity